MSENNLEAYQKAHKAIKQLKDIQGYDGNWNYDEYMRGLYNGIELALATLEDRRPEYKDPVAYTEKEHHEKIKAEKNG